MILYVGLIALLALQNAKFCLRSFNKNYLSKEGTDAVRGIFILLIFAAHFNSYADLTIAPLDIAYRKIWIAMGQMVVTCFLFYSGYGIALSARKKGDVYIHSMPRKRILPTLLIFDCSVILYLLLQIFRGRTYGIKELILALLAWGGFGNSNWYIFSILGCYLITWIVLRGRELNQVTVARITVCSVVFILALFCSGRDSWWYNTILCYPLGMWYFLYQDKIDLFMSKNTHYWPVLALTGIAFLVAHKFWYPSSSLTYMLTMLLFTLCVVFLTMKIQIRSPILIYCGKHLQGLYLLHRIPFIILGDILPWKSGPGIYIYFSLSFCLIFLLEAIFSKFITFLRGNPPERNPLLQTLKHSLARICMWSPKKRMKLDKSKSVNINSAWQIKAVQLFYIVAIPVFVYVLIVAIVTPANSYNFLPILTIFFAFLVWLILSRNRKLTRALLLKWCTNEKAAIIMMMLWGGVLVCFSIVFQVDFTWDYGGAMRASYQWATEGFVGNVEIYSRYPNNALLLTILYWACKAMLFIFPGASVENFRIVGCLISSFSIFISGLIFLKTSNLVKNGTGKIFLLIYMTCIPLWLYATICYTDTLGLPFLAGAFWCLAKMINAETRRSSIKWLILHSALFSAAFSMKATLAIPFIAALIFLALSCQKGKDALVRITVAIIVFITISSSLSLGTAQAIGITPELREKYEFPKTHWIMMSMNTQKETYGAGGYQQSDVDYTRSFENRAEREAAVMDRLIDRMKNPQRSLVEHILFQKVRRTWGNGSLAADDYAGRGIIYQSALHKFFLRNGTSWKPARTIMQFWWILLLGANLLGMIIQFKEGKLSFAFITHLTIFGFFLFYLIWETNSRYLVVLIPILTLSAADGICKFYNLDLTSTSKQGDDAF